MIQEQHWLLCDRILITDEEHHGSVMVDIQKKDGRLADEALIWSLCVDKPYRRQGVATRLLETAEREAQKRGCATASLEWDKREAERFAFNFYVRRGYNEKMFGRYGSLLEKQLNNENHDEQ